MTGYRVKPGMTNKENILFILLIHVSNFCTSMLIHPGLQAGFHEPVQVAIQDGLGIAGLDACA